MDRGIAPLTGRKGSDGKTLAELGRPRRTMVSHICAERFRYGSSCWQSSWVCSQGWPAC
jgi:hypothetical protein